MSDKNESQNSYVIAGLQDLQEGVKCYDSQDCNVVLLALATFNCAQDGMAVFKKRSLKIPSFCL